MGEKMTPIDHHQSRKSQGMSIHAETILDLIRTLPRRNVMLLVDRAIEMEIATRNTVHKSIMWLKNNAYITIVRNEGDGRGKTCSLTEKGKFYLDQL
jgi:DNA-binding MarR family transcriptional regulator